MGYERGSMGERTAVLYPDERKAAYEYNGAMQLTAMKVFSGEKQEQTVRNSYDEAGRLAGKQFPGGMATDYKYNSLGRISELRHSGKDVQIGYQYEYDKLGNKVRTVKERSDIIEDNGCFDYTYDGVNRLIKVRKDGKLLRNYTYDAFGNRSRTEYRTAGSLPEDRRYDAGAGRFISEDFIKGHTAVPYTMNHYSYCFNRPMDLVDLNGMWPSLKDIWCI